MIICAKLVLPEPYIVAKRTTSRYLGPNFVASISLMMLDGRDHYLLIPFVPIWIFHKRGNHQYLGQLGFKNLKDKIQRLILPSIHERMSKLFSVSTSQDGCIIYALR